MLSRDFCFWLQGFLELSPRNPITIEQRDVIAKHLNLVFEHEIDPSDGGPDVQEKLNAIHEGAKPEVPAKPELPNPTPGFHPSFPVGPIRC